MRESLHLWEPLKERLPRQEVVDEMLVLAKVKFPRVLQLVCQAELRNVVLLLIWAGWCLLLIENQQFIEVVKERVNELSVFKEGNHEHPKDVFYNSLIEVLHKYWPQLLIIMLAMLFIIYFLETQGSEVFHLLIRNKTPSINNEFISSLPGPILDSKLDTRQCIMISCHLEVAKSETILRVSMFWLYFKNMMEPSDSIFELPNLLIHATNVVKKLFTLSVLHGGWLVQKFSYDSETLLIVVDGALHGYDRVDLLFLYGLLEPEVGVVHVVDAFLEFIEVHGDLNHVDAYVVPLPQLGLIDLVIQVRCDDLADLLVIPLTQQGFLLNGQYDVLIFQDLCDVCGLQGLEQLVLV